MRIVKPLEKFSLLIKDVSKSIKRKQKNKEEDFQDVGASLFQNLLTDKRAIKTNHGRGTIRAGKTTIRTGQDF